LALVRNAGCGHGGDPDWPRLLAARGFGTVADRQHGSVAYGALGTPVIALSAVTGLDLLDLSAMIGR
jgi:L-lactate permease